MRNSNLSILFVVIVAFVTGCAGKRNRESVTTYWNDASDCQAGCRNCTNDTPSQFVETHPVNQSSAFGKNNGPQESAGSLNCLDCNRKSTVLVDGKCTNCQKQHFDRRALEIRNNREGLSGDEVGHAMNQLDETSQTRLPATTRRSLSSTDLAGSESVETQRHPDSDAISSPLKFLTPSTDQPAQADWNRNQSSPVPKIDPNFALDGNVAPHDMTGQELHPVKPLPIVSGDVVDKLPLKNSSKTTDDDAVQKPERSYHSTSETNSRLKAKGVATETEKQDSAATGETRETDPKSESFRLRDLFPNSIPNATFWTTPDATDSIEKSAPQTDDDIDWGLPKIVYPNWNQSQGNDGGQDSPGGSSGRNQGEGAPPLSPPDLWQGSSSSSELQFSNRSEQEIIRELRRSNLATRNGFDNTAKISQQKSGLPTVLLTAKPVPHYHQLLQIEQERNQSATVQTPSESNDRPLGSRPNRIPARSVSSRREIPIEEEFDFQPFPELTQPREFTLEPVEPEKFIEEVIETFSLPPLAPTPPANAPDVTNERDDQWFNADSDLLMGSGLNASDRNENRATHLPGSAGSSKANFRFEQPSFQRERSK